MIDYLVHYYRRGTQPFRSLSDLPDCEALQIMRDLYVAGSVIWERFKDPADYLQERRQIEAWLHKEFIAKGGRPQLAYPIYMVLGRSRWIESAADPATLSTTAEIQVPLGLFEEGDVSFTYPDSMVSALMELEKNPEYYEPDYHGKVFTLREIEEIISTKGLPGEGWQTRMPVRYAHYIEAQAWDSSVLTQWLTDLGAETRP